MLQVVNRINPDYPSDIDIDGKPLLRIATFIYNQMKLHYGPENHPNEILPIWEQLYTVVYSDPFYKDKSIATIANHIQEFWQKAKHGTKQLSGSKLKDKLASRFKGKE